MVLVTAFADHDIEIFSELERRDFNAAKSPYDALFLLLENGYDPIETLTRSAWTGHIPFMFSLVSLIQPRVYVELGSHRGASFFAACQSLMKLELEPSPVAVAIDLWEGDEHAGKYNNKIYREFLSLLQEKYSDVGCALRSSFDNALEKFEPGSIDLLHIDGLHTYEAARHDYETWKDKVSSDGVILFHDTAALSKDFGVWKLWEEISPAYASFNFQHTHGLGVIALGNNPMVPVLELLSNNMDMARFFEKHYAYIGKVSRVNAARKQKNRNLKTKSSALLNKLVRKTAKRFSVLRENS